MLNRVELTVIGKSSSRIGFGTSGLLRTGSTRQQQRILAAALDCGICHFDTAPIYGFGEAERALGRFLASQRARVTLTTKFGLQPSRLAARLLPIQRLARSAVRAFPTLRRAAIRSSAALYTPPTFTLACMQRSLEQSLRALRTDYVDFYLAHQASEEALPPEDLIGSLQDLRRAGKILAFGVATDFNRLRPVLQQRPQLSRVVQFDSELTSSDVSWMNAGHELVITYGFINRTVAECRRRIENSAAQLPELAAADDEALGGLLLRAAVLANPRGMVLMQSRSALRIQRNVEAANNAAADDRARRLVRLLETPV